MQDGVSIATNLVVEPTDVGVRVTESLVWANIIKGGTLGHGKWIVKLGEEKGPLGRQTG